MDAWDRLIHSESLEMAKKRDKKVYITDIAIYSRAIKFAI